MKKYYIALLLFCIALAIPAFKKVAAPSLIPREALLGNPQRMDVQISNDGKYVAYLAALIPGDETSKLNVWVRSIDSADDHPVTHETSRALRSFFWSNDSSEILYLQDTQGEENFRLYGVTLATKETRCYTPFDNVQVRIIPHPNEETSVILLGINKNDPAVHDVYALDLTTKELKFICANPGSVEQWAIDNNLCLRAGLRISIDGAKEIIYRPNETAPWSVIRTYALEDSYYNCSLIEYSQKHNLLYLIDTKDHDTARIIACNPDAGESTVIASDREYDITGAIINRGSEEVEAFYCNRVRPCFELIQQDGVCNRIVKAFAPYKKIISVNNRDNSQKRWLVSLSSDVSPEIYYVYDDEDGSITELFKACPDIDENLLAPMSPVSFQSSDGLTLHGYLTVPLHGKKNLPMVVMVHAGPEYRDSWGYNPRVQWLANRGYAVLQINYRGSCGYGKKFIQAAEGEWGGKMHDDLIDGVNWAVEKGIADPKRIAIFGSSYGGYAALVGAAFTPDVFCCAVDGFGMSNLVSCLKSIPPYWKAYRTRLYKMIGHPEEDEEFLKSRSPLFKVDAIKIPLFIAQGGQDLRVKQEESEQIVAELKKRAISYEYLLFPDEGHGFMHADHRLLFYKKAEEFLARHLGGSCQSSV